MTHALDEELYPLLSPFAEDYTYFRSSQNDAQRAVFIAGDIENPTLEYPLITDDLLSTLKLAWHRLNNAISHNTKEFVRHAYVAKSGELWDMIKMLEATHLRDDERFYQRSVRLYGEPTEDYYAYCMRQLWHRCERVRISTLDARVQYVISVLQNLSAPYSARAFVWDEVVLPQELQDNGPRLTATEVVQLKRVMLAERGLADKIHVAVREPEDHAGFEFIQHTQTSMVPNDGSLAVRSVPPTQLAMRALVNHEDVVHAGRYVNGMESSLMLLSVGLAQYLQGEEGVAVWSQQQVTGAREFAGQLGCLAVSLANGIDGTPRTFRELYELVTRMLLVQQIDDALYHGRTVDLDAFIKNAKSTAWTVTLRKYRGTTGAIPGACFTKDWIYLPGNVRIWQLLTEQPQWKHYLLIGKFDPTSEDHVATLRGLGLIP